MSNDYKFGEEPAFEGTRPHVRRHVATEVATHDVGARLQRAVDERGDAVIPSALPQSVGRDGGKLLIELQRGWVPECFPHEPERDVSRGDHDLSNQRRRSHGTRGHPAGLRVPDMAPSVDSEDGPWRSDH